MSKARRFLIVVASAGLALATASRAHAFTQSGAAQTSSEPSAVYTIPTHTTKLSPIVVQGHRLFFPLALQMIKTALHRSWSGARSDRNKLVCRLVAPVGSHLRALSCLTNAQHFKRQDATQLGMINAESEYRGGASNAILAALKNGQIPASIAYWSTQRRISASSLMPLLKKLPPAGSSYTMRITEHGKPIIDYVIKNGELAAIHHYIYKDQKKQD